jgi:acetyl-CoA carboxylase biotin carboxyl carrier protein|tara:strand:- start:1489 stop:1983 length:495 start_codon:yes stop_codon:yes gene_type:complete
MDLKDIQELIKFVAKSGATEVDLEIDNIKISIKSPSKKRRGETDEPVNIIHQVPVQSIPSQIPSEQNISIEKIEKSDSKDDVDSNLVEVKSSMIGTFYRSSSPDKPPFASVGDQIKEGDVICIVEAMKLFNEIESEISGKIVKVLVDDASPIEFDQPLFLVDPS